MLTDAKIAGLKATAGRPFEAADTVVPGLRLRVSTKSKTWVVRARMGGTVRTVTIGIYGHGEGEVTLASARAKAAALLDEARGGVIPLPKSPRRPKGERALTVTQAVEDFMRYCTDDRGMKRPEAYRQMLNRYVIPTIGEWHMKAVAKADLKSIVVGVRNSGKMTSARRVGGVIKRLFRWAAEEDLIPTDPGATLRLPGRELVRERTLTDAEIRALWHVTDPANDPLNLNKAGRVAAHPSQWPWGPFFRLALLLGQRRGELAVMKWSAIDMNARTWAMTSGETKSKRAHLIPLSDAATHILANMPRFEGCDFVFTTTGEGPIKDFSGSKALLDKTMGAHMEKQGHKLEPWRLHDLRRTCSTNLAALKVDPFIRRRVLNHALEGVDKIYDRYDYLDEKRAALDLWAARVGEIVAGGPSGDAAGGNVVQFRRRAKA